MTEFLVDGKEITEDLCLSILSKHGPEIQDWDKDDIRAFVLEHRVPILHPDKIEAAIRYLRKESWAFGLPQEENKGSVVRGTWKPEDFGL